MKNLELFAKYNNKNSKCEYTLRYAKKYYNFTEFKLINGEKLKKLIYKLNYIVEKNSNIKMPIVLVFGEIRFLDKLTLICFESYIYYIISNYHFRIYLHFGQVNHDITTEGIQHSPLIYLLDNNYDQKRFMNSFNRSLDNRHFRTIVRKDKETYLSKLATDLNCIIKLFGVEKEYVKSVVSMIVELVGNAVEHGETDCLVEIDVADKYLKKDEVENKFVDGDYYGINIVILNFSEKYLYTDLQKKIKFEPLKGRKYLELRNAYNVHKEKYFDKNYDENDFFIISAFQDKISGRLDGVLSGGTGLTQLIKVLEENADMANCYLLTAENVLFFKSHYLRYNVNDWIGFNKENDFINHRPNDEVLGRCYVFLPGSAYNLNFVMKRG